jgi:hypothetical protein
MKQFFILFLLLTVTYMASGQASDKVKQAYSSGELAKKSPEEIEFLRFYAEKCYVVHEAGKNDQSYPLLSSAAPGMTIDAVNPLLIAGSMEKHRFFTVDGSGQVLQLYSESYARILFRDFKNNQKNAGRK